MPLSVQTWLPTGLCVALHCRQAPHLLKQHVSFPCRSSSTQAQMINLIQLCIAGLWLNPIRLVFVVAIESLQFLCGFFFHFKKQMCDIFISFLYEAYNYLRQGGIQSLIIAGTKGKSCRNSGREFSELKRWIKKYIYMCIFPCHFSDACLTFWLKCTVLPLQSQTIQAKRHAASFWNTNAFLSASICGWSEPLVSLPFIYRFQRWWNKLRKTLPTAQGPQHADLGHNNDTGQARWPSAGGNYRDRNQDWLQSLAESFWGTERRWGNMTNFVSPNQEKHINAEKEMTQPEQSRHPRRGLHRWQTWPRRSVSQGSSSRSHTKCLREDAKWQLVEMWNVQITI